MLTRIQRKSFQFWALWPLLPSIAKSQFGPRINCQQVLELIQKNYPPSFPIKAIEIYIYTDVITDLQILQTFNMQEVENACVGV